MDTSSPHPSPPPAGSPRGDEASTAVRNAAAFPLGSGRDAPSPKRKSRKGRIVLFSVLGVFTALVLAAVGWYWYYFKTKSFRPVELSEKEQSELEVKLETVTGEPIEIGPEAVERGVITTSLPPAKTPEELAAEADIARRTIVFTEREINGLLHHNTDLAERLKIDLNDDVLVARVLHPFEEDTPFVGGKTLRVNCTLGAYLNEVGRLVLEVRDVTVSGVPLPNAWLGDIKHKNLIESEESPDGLLKRFADGIEDFKVEDGQVRVRLAP